jgi:hypothetical protein
MATPKDNMVLVKHLLDEYDDPMTVDKAMYILAKALDQQQKADTSRKLASEPYSCLSSANKPPSFSPAHACTLFGGLHGSYGPFPDILWRLLGFSGFLWMLSQYAWLP